MAKIGNEEDNANAAGYMAGVYGYGAYGYGSYGYGVEQAYGAELLNGHGSQAYGAELLNGHGSQAYGAELLYAHAPQEHAVPYAAGAADGPDFSFAEGMTGLSFNPYVAEFQPQGRATDETVSADKQEGGEVEDALDAHGLAEKGRTKFRW